jgi:protein SCO1/2
MTCGSIWDNDGAVGCGAYTETSSMTARLARIGVIAIVAFALGLVLARAILPSQPALPATELATVLPTPRALPALSLVRHDGKAMGADDFEGHWTLVFFGFTHCPDICPTTLALLAQTTLALDDLPASERPRVLFVSLDPERDNAQQIAAYVTFFDPAFVGATGSAAQVAAAAAAFSVPYAKVALPDGGYTIDHGSGIFVVGPSGGIVAFASGARDPAVLARDYRKVVDFVERTR